MRLSLFIFFFTILFVLPGQSQEQDVNRLKDPKVNFALQASWIIPTTLFRIEPNEGTFGDIFVQIEPQPGYQIGGIAAFRLNRSFQIHAGITMLRRNYTYKATRDNETLSLKMMVPHFEIPILLMYYQRLSSQVLLTAGTGVNTQSMLSNLGVKTGRFETLALYRNVLSPMSMTVLGMEYRRKKKGGYFLGVTYNVAPFTLFDTIFKVNFDGDERLLTLPHVGDYFGITGRYFFD
jgi:hypothetical protein